jgi:transcriptional repressor NrdR
MYCPVCNNKETSVVDSRPNNEGMVIRRRRECDKCHYRFSTIEEIELLDLVVIKSDGRREAYMRGKLEKSLRIPLTKRSYTEESFSKLIHAIERDIQKKKKRELTSKEVGESVMKHLRSFDKVAYIRFASVYRDFKDVKNFEKEVKKISDKN